MGKTSILTIMIQLAKKGDGDKATIKGLAQLKSNVGLVVGALGGFATVGAAVAVVFGKMTKAASDAEQVDSRLGAALLSTGRAAEISKQQINGVATSLMNLSSFDDEAIKGAYTTLTQFSTIPTAGFDDIVKAGMNVATFFGGDLNESIQQIGGALESNLIPKTWKFSAALKDEIKTAYDAGDSNKALQLILDELNKRYGGQAIQQLATYKGATDALTASWENAAEVGGSKYLNVLIMTKLALADLLDIGTQAATSQVQGNQLATKSTSDLARAHEELQSRISATNTKYQNAMLISADNAILQELAARGYTDVAAAAQVTDQGMTHLNTTELQLVDTGKGLQVTVDSGTYAMFGLSGSVDNATNSVVDFDAEMKRLNEILGGDLGPAQDDYNAKIAEYTRLLGEAKTQKEKDEINANIAAETEEYNKRATAIMFNIQQEAILNSTLPNDTKIGMITALGQAYGIYDEKTANAIITNERLVESVEKGTLTDAQAVSQMQFLTQGVKEHTGAIQSEAVAINYVGQHAENSVTKFEAMEKAQADLGAGVRHEALPAISSLNKQITGLPPSGTAWSYAFSISVSGSVPALPQRGSYVGKGHGYENNPGVDSEFASGGQLQFGAGWTMVGEGGAELISPTGYVFSHTDSMAMLAGGMYPEYQRKYAGPVGEKTGDWGYYSGEGPVVQAARRKKRSGSSPPTTGGNQSSDQSTAEVVAPLVASTGAAVQSAAAAQQQQVAEGIQTRNVIAQGNTDIADKLSETNDLLRNLNNTLPRSIGAAFQQANP